MDSAQLLSAMLDVDLLPCPFCGAQPRQSVHGGIVFIGCDTPNCPASHVGMPPTDEVEVVRRWNKRAVPSPADET